MSAPYPLPAYAANIWTRGQDIVIQFPPLAEGDKTSTITFPLTERGILCLQRILVERARSADLRISSKGTPCKRNVQAAIESEAKYKLWVAAMEEGVAMSAEARAEAELELEALGL
jgi:hypothetical protein